MRYGRKWMAAVAMGLLSLNAMAQKLTPGQYCPTA